MRRKRKRIYLSFELDERTFRRYLYMPPSLRSHIAWRLVSDFLEFSEKEIDDREFEQMMELVLLGDRKSAKERVDALLSLYLKRGETGTQKGRKESRESSDSVSLRKLEGFL